MKPTLSTEDAAVKVVMRTYPIDHPSMVKHLCLLGTNSSSYTSIMLHRADRLYGSSHYKVHHDTGGWYIRQGKRGSVKSYLSRCDVTFIDGEPSLFEFRLEKSP